MTDILVPPTAASLSSFVEAGVFGPTEIHLVATLAGSAHESDPTVLLGAALAARAPLHGSVCIDVASVADTVVSSLREPVDVAATGTADEAGPDDADFDDDTTYQQPGDATSDAPDLDALDWPDPQRWLEALAGSDLVEVVPDGSEEPVLAGDGLLRPLVLDHGRLYLSRYWHLERLVATDLRSRTEPPSSDSAGVIADPESVAASVQALFEQAAARTGTPVDPHQLTAAQAVANRNLVVVAGGPGTGKTTTVARLLAGIVAASPGARATSAVERIALAAPTGKAAARMTEALRLAISVLKPDLDAELVEALSKLEAVTIHRLLGTRGAGFWHGPQNPLPHDIVIIDEVSMVSLSLMAHLLAAIRNDAKVVLVGDPHQLASVEAGTVLGDVVGVRGSSGEATPPAGVAPSVRPLATVHRQAEGSAILDLAAAIRGGRADEVMEILADTTRDDVRWVDAVAAGVNGTAATAEHVGGPGDRSSVVSASQGAHVDRLGGQAQGSLYEVGLGAPLIDQERVALHRARLDAVRAEIFTAATTAVRAASRGPDDEEHLNRALDAIESVKVLCAMRIGDTGVDRWNRDVDDHLRAARLITRGDWYAGRPAMVTENDYVNQVFNGDVGVSVPVPGTVTDGSVPDRYRVVFRRMEENKVVEAVRLDRVVTQWAMSIHKSQGSEFPHAVVVLPPPPARILTRELLYTGVTRAKDRLTMVASEDSIRAAVDRPVARASGLAARLS